MKISFTPAAVVMGLLVLVGGCRSAPYRPAGFTEHDVTRKMQDVQQTCESLRMGTPVQVKFYSGEIKAGEIPAGGVLNGYFYACNPWHQTISLSEKPLGWLDRGQTFFLEYVDQIIPMNESAMLSPMLSLAAVPSK
jgi:hypothetical protein